MSAPFDLRACRRYLNSIHDNERLLIGLVVRLSRHCMDRTVITWRDWFFGKIALWEATTQLNRLRWELRRCLFPVPVELRAA